MLYVISTPCVNKKCISPVLLYAVHKRVVLFWSWINRLWAYLFLRSKYCFFNYRYTPASCIETLQLVDHLWAYLFLRSKYCFFNYRYAPAWHIETLQLVDHTPVTSDTNSLNSENSNSKSELTVFVREYFVDCPFIVSEKLILHIWL